MLVLLVITAHRGGGVDHWHLLLVVVLIGFDGEIGRLTLVLTAIIGVFLLIGWFGVRGRINAAAMTESMDVVSSIAPLEDPVKDNPNEK